MTLNHKKTKPLFFVTQGSLTENFCEITESISSIKIEDYEVEKSSSKKEEINNEEIELVDIIKEQAKSYISKEALNKLLEQIYTDLTNVVKISKLNNLFDFEILKLNNYLNIENIKSVAKWVNENKGDFIVDVQKDLVETNFLTTKVKFPLYEPIMIVTNLDVSFVALKIRANSKFPNICPFVCNMVFLLSKYDTVVYYNNVSYKQVGWDAYQKDTIVEWHRRRFEYKDYDKQDFTKIFEKYENYINKSLKIKFSKSSD